MTNAKTLMVAAATALTLGVGTAMAQSEVPSSAAGDYFAGQRQAAVRTAPNRWSRIQAGASDIKPGHVGRVLPFNGDYTRLANRS